MTDSRERMVAILCPCYNEAPTIAAVIRDFRRVLPDSIIVVGDNGSTDDTAAIARDAGATVIEVERRGKGNVMRALFARVSADIYVMVDADCTYSAEDAPALLQPLLDGAADIVVGARVPVNSHAIKPLNSLANRLIGGFICRRWGVCLTDVFSGYRALTREAVHALALRAGAFEIETEMTDKALRQGLTIVEVATGYDCRPPDSFSKLSFWRDGVAILLYLVKSLFL
jgi:glycosyltransferase involved in cell wall biosynthesis